jgi:hypothetical protein
VPELHARALVQGRDPAALRRLLPGVPDWEPRLRDLVATWWDAAGRDPRRADLMWARNRTARFNVQSLVAAGRDGLDYVTPFLDEAVVRTCYGMDERWQRHSIAYRRAICMRWPELARIPWQKTGLPVHRYPGRRDRAVARLRRAAGIGSRSTPFSDQTVYERAFGALIEESLHDLQPLFADLGIDLPGLLAAHPAGTPHGGALRLRAATIGVSLRCAQRARGQRRAERVVA